MKSDWLVPGNTAQVRVIRVKEKLLGIGKYIYFSERDVVQNCMKPR